MLPVPVASAALLGLLQLVLMVSMYVFLGWCCSQCRAGVFLSRSRQPRSSVRLIARPPQVHVARDQGEGRGESQLGV